MLMCSIIDCKYSHFYCITLC